MSRLRRQGDVSDEDGIRKFKVYGRVSHTSHTLRLEGHYLTPLAFHFSRVMVWTVDDDNMGNLTCATSPFGSLKNR